MTCQHLFKAVEKAGTIEMALKEDPTLLDHLANCPSCQEFKREEDELDHLLQSHQPQDEIHLPELELPKSSSFIFRSWMGIAATLLAGVLIMVFLKVEKSLEIHNQDRAPQETAKGLSDDTQNIEFKDFSLKREAKPEGAAVAPQKAMEKPQAKAEPIGRLMEQKNVQPKADDEMQVAFSPPSPQTTISPSRKAAPKLNGIKTTKGKSKETLQKQVYPESSSVAKTNVQTIPEMEMEESMVGGSHARKEAREAYISPESAKQIKLVIQVLSANPSPDAPLFVIDPNPTYINPVLILKASDRIDILSQGKVVRLKLNQQLTQGTYELVISPTEDRNSATLLHVKKEQVEKQ